ncbi:hypothetical protein [Paraburkholderia sp. CNPSo 3281]|uniref:hypothetical protein n=1 Tax=Paraburkholderia sp. CNPSo 3281 TaxID=2940933 RepID=UPI0035CD017B
MPDAVDRLAQLVRSITNNDHPKLSVITDGANGLQTIASQLPFTPKSVLDWFHISMRVRYLEQIAKGLRVTSEPENAAKHKLTARIGKLRWCFWHGNAAKAASRMREISTICRSVAPQTPQAADSLAQLGYRVRELVAYVKANGGSTINYGKLYREGEPISTAMAE